MGEGTTYPAVNTLLAAWIPRNERAMASAFVYGGAQVSELSESFWIYQNLKDFDCFRLVTLLQIRYQDFYFIISKDGRRLSISSEFVVFFGSFSL